jgi:2-polyprenyl-3-methyl-5-hydroxy-6-metoxy-1,4-benzoquinol methylase
VERKYEGAGGYYARYRPPYPPALVTVLRDAFRLDGKGQLLDLGCGPGSVAIRVAHLFERVVAMDPEPDMLSEGAAIARRSGIRGIEWTCGSSEDPGRHEKRQGDGVAADGEADDRQGR